MLHKNTLLRFVVRNNQRLRCSTQTPEAPKNKVKSNMPKELTRESDVRSKVEFSKLVKKEDLQWRTPWQEQENQRLSVLRTFYKEESNAKLLKFLQSPIDISPSAIRKWWLKREETKKIYLQQYIPERNQVLGNELAAAHFVVYRGGAVKFYGEDRWIKADEFKRYSLPKHYDATKILQAIDCSEMELYYEGLVNFKNLHQLEWLSINDCNNMDDWCMDRICHVFGENLLYLDIRDCPKITERGLGALYRMRKLKILYVTDMYFSKGFEMTCIMLQDLNPELDIRVQ